MFPSISLQGIIARECQANCNENKIELIKLIGVRHE